MYIFRFIVKIVKEPDHIHSLIPNTSQLTFGQRYYKIAKLIMWFLMIMKRLSRNNENIPQYINLFDQFERTIGYHIMNANWYDNNLIHQHIVKYLLQQWFWVKTSI